MCLVKTVFSLYFWSSPQYAVLKYSACFVEALAWSWWCQILNIENVVTGHAQNAFRSPTSASMGVLLPTSFFSGSDCLPIFLKDVKKNMNWPLKKSVLVFNKSPAYVNAVHTSLRAWPWSRSCYKIDVFIILISLNCFCQDAEIETFIK